MIKLFYDPISTYSQRILIAADEMKINLDLVVIDLKNGEHKQEAYLSINPFGCVPTIQDGEFVLYESTAILQYLEEKYQSNQLMPEFIEERAEVNMHMKICDLYFTSHAGVILKQMAFLPEEKWDLASMALARKGIEEHLVLLDGHLADKKFLVAEKFTLADVCYVTFLPYLSFIKIDVPHNVQRWINELFCRESVQKYLPIK